MRLFYFLIMFLLLFSGCTLERSNPLDIEFNPVLISDIKLVTSSESTEYPWIDISWKAIPNVDGYIVYRSLSYNGNYVSGNRIVMQEGIEPNQNITYRDEEKLISNEYYFYKISSFKIVGNKKLEGPKSAYVMIRLP